MSTRTLIRNAQLVLPARVIENGWLLIEDERILALGESTSCPDHEDTIVDAVGKTLVPGIIDLHCDAIERLVMPRPDIYFDLPIALQEADWLLAGCGITTEFHAVSLDDGEFGVRSTTFARDLYRVVHEGSDWLVRHKIHARVELTSQDGSDVAAGMIEQRQVNLVSLMDHSPGQGQYRTEQSFRDYVIRKGNKSSEDIDILIAVKREQAAHVNKRIERIANLAHEASLALATHDDDSAEKVAQWPRLGVTVSEFPTTFEAARQARDLGLAVCMGAPNVLRGKSSGGNMSAIEAIQAGVVNVLCSDYYPSAMLGAIYKLVKRSILPLPEATALVTLNPARAVGLSNEYGSLEVGKIADLIIVNTDTYGVPRVQHMFVAGKERVRRG